LLSSALQHGHSDRALDLAHFLTERFADKDAGGFFDTWDETEELGRLLYETGKYDRAVDRYQEIPRESEYFVDALYETAWAQVKSLLSLRESTMPPATAATP